MKDQVIVIKGDINYRGKLIDNVSKLNEWLKDNVIVMRGDYNYDNSIEWEPMLEMDKVANSMDWIGVKKKCLSKGKPKG